ncbi:RDD family protein [Streptomyces sp. XD-27]|uniref:RDD family protein n=1 Tax=Streptomyces sp. XD-27 TaxID=3062779 RepID=UPI0026F47190|nr:RDD family protein [Streptomyces sp. XD-27]WKX69078.1 RDD family protein [Streptomyces sp. XD-27]
MNSYPPQQSPYGHQPPQAPYGYPYPQQPYPYMPMGPAGPPPHLLADPGSRLGARLLDALFVLVGCIVANIPSFIAPSLATRMVGILAFVAAFAVYEPVMLATRGATFGKQICGLGVVRLEDGGKISGGKAFGRWAISLLMGIVPILGLLNILWCCWDKPNRQCLHDKVVTTVVIRTR